MKVSAIATVLAASVGLASAAPAIVWKSGSSSASGPSHISDAVDTRSLLSSSVGDNDRDSSALAAVVFLVGRDADGYEGLASLASSGNLPGVQEKYGSANEIHHHVQGVESSRTMVRDARESGIGSVVAEVSMEEFQRKLSSIAQTEVIEGEVEGKKFSKAEQKRRRAISEADVLIVNVGANEDAAKIDSAIVAAIDSSAVNNVVLSSIRSIGEIKHARKLATMERFTNKSRRAARGSRRLDEQDENNQNNNNQDMEGVYYVNMTPNIFAGLLFFFLFVFTAHLGLTCMNMIEGQDVYVKKMPHIGREV
ncbi:hypothetical protein ACHAXR_000848 [Thalassiosira sp. AJA248-18]